MSDAVHDAAAARSTVRTDKLDLLANLAAVVGRANVLTGNRATRRYRTGFRFGTGSALAVVKPGSLVEQWKVLQACIAANVVVIAQASNTGLTGGSTPDGDDYDRPVVIVSTSRLKKIYVISGGTQVICLPGATLDQLERTLAPLGREPHSVIGSSCIGASVFGGVCNNSGGALVNRGPAYTELSVFAHVDETRTVRLVNHLGVQLGDEPEAVLRRLDEGDFSDADIRNDVGAASDRRYAEHVRDVDADTPARFNADPQRLFEASGSAGKVMVFALRLDTFPIESGAKVYYIGTNNPSELTGLRRGILRDFTHLPIAGEYMHRDAFDVAEKYGKDTFLMIEKFGTRRLPAFFNMKSRCDQFFEGLPFLPKHLSDRLLQFVGQLLPNHLPRRMKEYRERYEHHLLLKVSARNAEEAYIYFDRYFAGKTGGFFECSQSEGQAAFLNRFVAAGAAVRYRAVHSADVEDIVALDVALRRNDEEWIERLPQEFNEPISLKLYYGHFLCHVFHQDYVVKKGYDCLKLEHQLWKLLDARGGEYPAEHNVGHLYPAKPSLRSFYERLDPCNCLNPGIGQMSKFESYREPNQ